MIVLRLSGQELRLLAALAVAPLVGWASARAAAGLGAAHAGAASPPGSSGGVSAGWMSVGAGLVALSAGVTAPELAVPTLGLGWALLVLASVDLAVLRLPDVVTLPLCGLGLALGGLAGAPLADRGLGLAFGATSLAALDLVYLRIRGRSGIGLGDAKLYGAAGAWLGWRALPPVLLLACAGGLAWVAVRLLLKGRASAGAPLPFGAPLCAAIWTVWLEQATGRLGG